MADRRVITWLFLPLFAACVAAPVRQPPDVDVTPPDRWTAGARDAGGVETDWVGTFDDPRLVELVETALRENLDLRIAAEVPLVQKPR